MRAPFVYAVILLMSAALHAGCGSDSAGAHDAGAVTGGAAGSASDAAAGGGGAIDAPPDSAASGACGASVCKSDEFCNWTDNGCGDKSKDHSCTPISSACEKDRPVCGCDGVAYLSQCEAMANGADMSLYSGCGEIEGWFHCGPAKFCKRFEEACNSEGDDMSGVTSYGCVPLPPCEPATPICDCIKAIPCTFESFNHLCTDDGKGAVNEGCFF